MTQELYERIIEEQNSLESQYSPWDSEANRSAYMEAFTDFLASQGVMLNDYLDELQRRIDRHDAARVD
jgi:hypothetical protein